MSKTIKTRPLWVRLSDPRDKTVGVTESHNHVKGFCDLPENNPKAIQDHYDDLREHSTHSYKSACKYLFSYQGANICGCRMCTGHDYRKQENRKNRHENKVSLKATKKSLGTLLNKNPDPIDDEMEELSVTDPRHIPAPVF